MTKEFTDTDAQSKVALLIIDMISDFEFEDGEKLFKFALPMAKKLAKLKEKARRAEVPVIYINDNFGNWKDDFGKTLHTALKDSARGRKIAELLKPDSEDYFVLKPKHSAFYSTTLDLLLKSLKVKKLILTGVSTDICILFTANDAYMREYEIFIPQDCVASVVVRENKKSLEYIERVLKAKICVSDEIDFAQMKSI